MQPLYEKLRPRTFADVIGQDAITKRLQFLASRDELRGQCYWLSGLSGTGKTTIARIIAKEISGDCDMNVVEIDAGKLNVETLDNWERACRMRPMFGCGIVLILNEAHGLRKDMIRRLLVTIESIPDYCSIIFTTTKAGQQSLFEDQIDAAPLISRCVKLELESALAKLELPYASWLLRVARAEQCDGKPIADYIALVRNEKGNLRACLNFIQSGGMLS